VTYIGFQPSSIVYPDLLSLPSLWLLFLSNGSGAIFYLILVQDLIIDTQIGEKLSVKISTNKGPPVEIFAGPDFGLCSPWDLRLV
jgi:hypothetical protein